MRACHSRELEHEKAHQSCQAVSWIPCFITKQIHLIIYIFFIFNDRKEINWSYAFRT